MSAIQGVAIDLLNQHGWIVLYVIKWYKKSPAVCIFLMKICEKMLLSSYFWLHHAIISNILPEVDYQIHCSDLTKWYGTSLIAPLMPTRVKTLSLITQYSPLVVSSPDNAY